MFSLVKTILALLGLLVILAVGVYLGAKILSGGGEDLDFFRTLLSERVAARLIRDLKNHPDIQSLCLYIPSGEKHELFNSRLEEALEAEGLIIADAEEVKPALKKIFGDRLEVIKTDGQASELARIVGTDATLVGELKQFSRGKGGLGAKVDFGVRLVEAKSPDSVVVRKYRDEIGSRFSPAFIRGTIHESSPWMRIFAWILFVVLLPFLTISVVKRLLRRESNLHNALMLAGYTGVDLLVALILTGFYLSGFLVWVLLFLALSGGCFYNFLAFTKIEELSH